MIDAIFIFLALRLLLDCVIGIHCILRPVAERPLLGETRINLAIGVIGLVALALTYWHMEF